MKLNKGQGIAAAVIVAAIGTIIYKATRSESVVTFYTPQEVYAAPEKFEGKTFRVSGLVLNGTKEWDAAAHSLRFRMTDLKGHEFTVKYQGIPPDLFKEGQGVIVEGRLQSVNLAQDNTLLSTLLMVKHSEVYDTSKDHANLREAKVLDSILKAQ